MRLSIVLVTALAALRHTPAVHGELVGPALAFLGAATAALLCPAAVEPEELGTTAEGYIAALRREGPVLHPAERAYRIRVSAVLQGWRLGYYTPEAVRDMLESALAAWTLAVAAADRG